MEIARRQLLLPNTAPTGRGVRVAVIDTGVDLAHPDLQGRVRLDLSSAFTYQTARDDIQDFDGHGTHIAGIIGGSGAASGGRLRGIAPECELIVYKVSNSRKSVDSSAMAAVEAALDAGAQIINFSHGYAPDVGAAPWVWSEQYVGLEQQFELAANRGVLLVVAAGNAGPNNGSITRPGGLSCVLTVGGLNHHDQLLPESGRGPFRRSHELRRGLAVSRFDSLLHRESVAVTKPDVVAPGEVNAPRARGCFTINFAGDEAEDQNYIPLRGSSQATAVVTGLATLLLDIAQARSINLGSNPGRTLHRLIKHAAAAMSSYPDESDVGSGILHWPRLVATLEDFATDLQFRTTVLVGNTLRLM